MSQVRSQGGLTGHRSICETIGRCIRTAQARYFVPFDTATNWIARLATAHGGPDKGSTLLVPSQETWHQQRVGERLRTQRTTPAT